MSSARPFVKNPALTAIAMGYKNGAHIADLVLPRVPVPGEQFKYTVHGKEHFIIEDDLVGRTGRVNRIEFSAGQQDGSVVDRGLETPIPKSDIDAAARMANFDPKNNASLKLTKKIDLGRELRVANAVFNPAVYPIANKTTLSGTAQWSDYATNASRPIDDIYDAREGMLIKPNTLVLGSTVFSKLVRHPHIIQAIHGTTGDKGVATLEQLRNLLNFERLLVGEAWLNTANKGQAETMARAWGNHAAMLYIDQNLVDPDEITFGFSATYDTRLAWEKEDENIGLRGGVVVRVGESIKEMITAPDVGFFFQDAVV